MSDELIKFLEERQRQIFREKTDRYGRFKSSDCETFYEGYLECMQDIYDFLQRKEQKK